jgi:guanylate kinase
MDNVVAEKFCNNFNLTNEQIKKYEDFYNINVLPIIGRHFLSHLVTTIEELINEKQKHAFLERIKNTINDYAEFDYAAIEKAINRKMLRLFSIILVPVESGKLKARTHLISGGHGVLITYWKQLPEDQIRF